MQTIEPMNSNSVLFCSVRANCVLKTFLKSRQFSFSHNKDRLAKCRYGILPSGLFAFTL
mgnify:CR=1 FL=1